jgi:hypothetical protein
MTKQKKYDNKDFAPAPGVADSQECLLEEELKKERVHLLYFRAHLFDFQIWFQLTESDLRT